MANPSDFARVKYVLDNFDTAELLTKPDNKTLDLARGFMDKNDRPAKLIKFKKRIDGTIHVVETVAENKHKKNWVLSSYEEKDKGTRVSDANLIPEPHVQNEHASSLSSSNVSLTDAEVNRQTVSNAIGKLGNKDVYLGHDENNALQC